MPEFVATRLKWLHDGDWDNLLRGCQTLASTARVKDNAEWILVIRTSSKNGEIEIGDAIKGYSSLSGGINYYRVDKVTDNPNDTTTIELSGYKKPDPWVLDELVYFLHKEPFVDATIFKIDQVLNQIGGNIYLLQWMAASTLSLRQGNGAAPTRFYYPNKTKPLEFSSCFIDQPLGYPNGYPPGTTVIKVKMLNGYIKKNDTVVIEGLSYNVLQYNELTREIFLAKGLLRHVICNVQVDVVAEGQENFSQLVSFIEMVAQTVRTYMDFPAIIMGFDYEAHFTPDMIQLNRCKIWQWVDKKRAQAIEITKLTDKTGRIKTIPCLQLPTHAIMDSEVFHIIKKDDKNPQRYFLGLDLKHPHEKGALIQTYRAAYSMDIWNESQEDFPTAQVTLNVNQYLWVIFMTGPFNVGDTFIVVGEEFEYTIVGHILPTPTVPGSFVISPVPIQQIPPGAIIKRTKAAEITLHRTKPLTQKAAATFIRYNYVTPASFEVIAQVGYWLTMQNKNAKLYVGEYFHIVDSTDLYKITRVNENEIEFWPPMTDVDILNKTCEVTRSSIDLASGIRYPHEGEWFFSTKHPSSQHTNMIFNITGIDPETLDLEYGTPTGNFTAYDVYHTWLCTKYIYKVNDFCYNNPLMPRPMEYLTELLYEFQRIIEIMWEYVQLINNWLLLDTPDFLEVATAQLREDPYFALYFVGEVYQ